MALRCRWAAVVHTINDIDHQPQGAELVFLSFPITLTQFATSTVKHNAGKLMALLSTV